MRFLKRLARDQESRGDAEWQTPIVQEICAAMLRLIPPGWDSATIVLEVTDKGLGAGLTHSAIMPNTVRDFAATRTAFVQPDSAVMAATRKLELGWAERQMTFRRAVISAIRDGEDWLVKSEYEQK